MPTPPRPRSEQPRRALVFAVALIRRAVRFEIATWVGLTRWLLRRPYVARGGTAFGYRGPLMAPLLAFFAISLVETVAVDLLVPWPWQWLRIAVLSVGVWGVLWTIGLLAVFTVRPHVAEPAGLRIRHGTSLDVLITWDAVTGARRQHGSRDGREIQLDDTTGTLHVQVSHQSTVAITLARPVTVALPSERTALVTAVRLHADDAAALITAVGARTGTGAHR